MLNLKQTLRIIFKNKKTTFLLLLSLSIGLSAFMLITAKVTYNRTFDTYLDNHKNVYRIISSTYTNKILTISEPRTQRILGQLLKENYPEVKGAGFLCKPEESNYKIGDNLFLNENSFHCSNEMVDIFKLEIIQGQSDAILKKPNKVIVSESFANKYFRFETPIGKIIQQFPSQEYEIEAVYKDFPKNSHIAPDFLISFNNNMFLPPPLKENWGWVRFYTYLELGDNADIKKLEDNITELCYENNRTQLESSESEYKFKLQAIGDIHTKSNYKNDIAKTVKGQYLSILQIVSIFILIISGFNYIYFSYSRISVSSTQYGIKKVLGASNGSLFLNFLFESLLVHIIAITISVFAIIFSRSITGFIIGDVSYNDLHGNYWIYLLVIFIISTIANPLMVIFLVTRKSSLEFLSKKISNIQKPFSFQQIFTVAQFVLIVFLISSILGINKQVNFLKDKDKGLEIDNKLVIKTPGNWRRESNIGKNLDSFEQEIAKIAGVKNISTSDKVPGDIPTFSFSVSEQKGVNGIKTAFFIAGNEFLESYSISIIEGGGLVSQNRNACIINSTCMKQLGYGKPAEIIGKRIYLQDESMMQTIEASINGVCEDFNFMDAKEMPGPIIFMDWTREVMLGNYTLAVNSQINKGELIAQTESFFKKAFPNYPFSYFWVEDYYNKQFEDEISIIRSLKIFTVLAILLGVLSLLSMVTQICLNKTKEIGIRKVNGAKQSDIISLLNIQFVRWIGLACIIAVPLSWFFMMNWQEAFAYKANIGVWIFIISSGLAIIIGVLTVTVQSLKAANMNPVESIKYE
jgi:putative ABC transport system permease protein